MTARQRTGTSIIRRMTNLTDLWLFPSRGFPTLHRHKYQSSLGGSDCVARVQGVLTRQPINVPAYQGINREIKEIKEENLHFHEY